MNQLNPLMMTNARKAAIMGFVTAVLGLLPLFGVDVTAEQIGGIIAAVNALLLLWVAFTYQDSPARIADYGKDPA